MDTDSKYFVAIGKALGAQVGDGEKQDRYWQFQDEEI
jgi:hypothetical protein